MRDLPLPPRPLLASLLLAGLCMPKAQATGHAYTYDNCTAIGDTHVIAHVVGTFTSDSERLDVLTDWIHIPHTQAWSCTRYSRDSPSTLQTILKVLTPTAILKKKFDFEGERYDLYASGPAGDTRLGYIMRRKTIIESGGQIIWESAMVPLTDANDDFSHDQLYKLTLHGTQVPYTVRHEAQVRLFKWRDVQESRGDFPRTGKATEFQVAELQYWVPATGTAPPKGLPAKDPPMKKPRRYSRVRAWFNRDDNTCTTPASKTVRLPPAPKSAFAGVNTTTGDTLFQLQLSNCASSINRIEYKLVPVRLSKKGHRPTALETVEWASSYPNGTLPLGTGSTASGVGVQVLDGDGNPVVFDRDSMRPVFDFKQGDTTANIPLQARYIQTTPNMTTGRVYATMSVLYMYK